jgi:tetratricopeptide (TPR) repeat protein
MIPARFRFFVLILIFILLMVCLSINSWAREKCENWVGKIVSVQGSVEALKIGENHWDPVRLNDTYCIGDMIRVQKNSRAALILVNAATLRLDQESSIIFSPLEEKETLFLKLLRGAAHFFSRIPHTLKLATPFVNGGVEGTEFFVRVDENKTFISVFEGKVLASNNAGSLTLTSGQSAIAEAGKAPVARVVARPRDAVHWALYYPPVIYVRPEGAAVKEDTNDPRYLANHASLLLSVGRVDEASADIERALALDPKYSDAYALQSIIAVVRNDKQKALDLAKKAVEIGPKSATAQIALSYAQQASFNLEDAHTSLEEAVKLAPQNALAWARLAEIWSSFGELGKALDAAQTAVSLDPNLSRTQSVLGFAYLTQLKTKASQKAFEKAIELDQASPLPRLGLGLAKIREGNLKDGGKEIEIAASLDPNNSIVRSYLGKVYYEEKRTKLDGREYKVAKELDPQDPTPWFYDAIRKQTINRPVEALQDLQKSIELNDNRAVYRSRLLLDSDLAARSSSLARIYNNLGFQQLGLVEGWKSVNTDPGNFSAHRFLADSYAALPNHEIARVSELLQSQLLQPINITPIQPQLAESNLKILEGLGPSALSFNEFNPLFQRNRVALQASGIVGGNSTHSNDLVFSGVYGRTSFSIGQFHGETDGFRENNDQKQNIYNMFAQASLSHKTSIQVEYRNTDKKTGDLTRLFDPDNFLTNQRIERDTESFRFGFHHAFSPNSDLIASIIYQDADSNQRSLRPIPGAPLEISNQTDTEIDGYTAETQYQFRHDRFNIIAGLGYFDADREDIFKEYLIFPGLPPMPTVVPPPDQTDIQHTNFYVYSQVKYPEKFIWTLGGSLDHFHGGDIDLDTDQFNPKLGMTWNPVQNTTLRAAAFRVFKRTLISNQTVEPTQVAGFNQYFDDSNATDSWRYGIAVDQKFTSSLYGGMEISQRDLEIPYSYSVGATSETREANWKQRLGRAYFYWTPHRWLSLSAEYQYERSERDIEFMGLEQFTYLKTHKLPLGINFYHPSGLSLGLKVTYVDQSGVFVDQLNNSTEDSDQFWVVDATLSYRLPDRYGILSVECKNLFDETFKFLDTDPANPATYPERLILVRLTLSF